MFRKLASLRTLPARALPAFNQTRSYKVERKQKHKQPEYLRREAEQAKWPLFSKTLKQFYVKVHPDLLHAHPEAKIQNEKSLQDLMGFISEIQKKEEKWPPCAVKRLAFYVKTNDPGVTFRRVILTLATSGGQCSKLVGKQFSTFFASMGLPAEFRWDDKYWPLKDPMEYNKEKPAEEQEEE
jgi:hypothetical protein